LRRFRKGNYGGAVEKQLTEEGEIIPQASSEKRNLENPDGEDVNGFEVQTFNWCKSHN